MMVRREPFLQAKAWGVDELIYSSHCVDVHLLTITPPEGAGVQCSLHEHKRLHNFFRVLFGKLLVDVDNTTHVLSPGEQIAIHAGKRHRFAAREHTVAIEIVWTDTLGDDIARLEPGGVY